MPVVVVVVMMMVRMMRMIDNDAAAPQMGHVHGHSAPQMGHVHGHSQVSKQQLLLSVGALSHIDHRHSGLLYNRLVNLLGSCLALRRGDGRDGRGFGQRSGCDVEGG